MTIADLDLQAYNASIREPVSRLADDLRRMLGARLTAYIAGAAETRAVRLWAEGARRPVPDTEQVLRLAHRVAALIAASEGEGVAPAWFQGMNPHLGDRSPARVLREGPFEQAGPRVLAAAEAFVGN